MFIDTPPLLRVRWRAFQSDFSKIEEGPFIALAAIGGNSIEIPSGTRIVKGFELANRGSDIIREAHGWSDSARVVR